MFNRTLTSAYRPQVRRGITLAVGFAATLAQVSHTFADTKPGEPRHSGIPVEVVPVEQRTIQAIVFVNCWLVVQEHQNALVLPYNTLVYEGRNSHVFVLDESGHLVERREVTPGIHGLQGIEIANGIEAGEQVVGMGRNRLTPGTRVEVVAERGATP
ncbi:MAG: hypothetical protein PVG22_11555 [Chromatiales bacterium]|jgi:multidrug efflux pump subunit AcrA (membrane-fusion protein)